MKIVLEKDQNLFFTSDSHYNHSNICRGTSNWGNDQLTRDFQTLEFMNSVIVNNINSKVGQNDILVHMGDFSFGGFEKIQEFRDKIVCKNIILFFGNHDHHIRRNRENIQSIFTACMDYDMLDVRRPSFRNKGMVDKFGFVCMHFPIASWDNISKGVIHLHGHVHLPSHLKVGIGRSLDVGVDGNDLDPYSLDEVLNLVKNQPNKKLQLPRDHHED